MGAADIKLYAFSNKNAPKLQNAYGSMRNVLDACLVNGIPIGEISSLTAVGTVVTAIFTEAHQLMKYQLIKISGANESEYNGEHQVMRIPNANTVEFDFTSTPSTMMATGSISGEIPPLGWARPFSSEHAEVGGKAAYRSNNSALTCRPFLRVVDEPDPLWPTTYCKYAKVGMIEDMTDIDTMLGTQQPYDTSFPDRNWVATTGGTTATLYNGWSKWHYAKNGNNTAANAMTGAVTNGDRRWFIIGNSDYFYVLNCCTPTDTHLTLYFFGTFPSFLNTDTYNAMLNADMTYNQASSGFYACQSLGGSVNNNSYSRALRSYKGEEGNNYLYPYSFNPTSSVIYSGSNDRVASVATSGYVFFTDVFLLESGSVPRGRLPSMFWLMQNNPTASLEYIERDGEIFITMYIAFSSTRGAVMFQLR